MAFSFLLITACYSPFTQNTDISTRKLTTSSECRVIQHKLGETCIPVKPQRIITLEVSWILDPLLALGIKPVGTVSFYGGGRGYFPGLSTEEVAGIEIVGTPTGPNIEKILKLKPDLILSLDSGNNIYQQLSSIAPTVVRAYDNIKLSFKENFRAIAQLLGESEKAEKVLTQYKKRIETLQKLLGNRREEIEISVITYYTGSFSIPASYAPFFQVFNDIGLRLKPVFIKQNEYVPFSIEAINEYDADILFIVNFDNKPSSYFFQNPLISSLKAAKNKRAYIVKADTWWSYGPLGMNKLLDELPQYLLESMNMKHAS